MITEGGTGGAIIVVTGEGTATLHHYESDPVSIAWRKVGAEVVFDLRAFPHLRVLAVFWLGCLDSDGLHDARVSVLIGECTHTHHGSLTLLPPLVSA